MSSHAILDEFISRTGWNTNSCALIVADYIDSQQSDEAFLNHLFESTQVENAASGSVPPELITTMEGLTAHQGWSKETVLDLMLSYIENQQSPDAFRDHLSEAESIESSLTSSFY